MITLTLTEEEALMVRVALYDKSLRMLGKAFETKEELQQLGRDDFELADFYMNEHEMYNNIIENINKELEA